MSHGNIGVYEIYDKINGKRYIGSSVNINGRWREHKKGLRDNKHQNKHLQKSYNKHGGDNLVFKILEITGADFTSLDAKEQYFIDTCIREHGRESVYNIQDTVAARHPVSEETRRKISEASKGNQYMLGKHHSDETKKKISEARTGKYLSDETREKIRQANTGKNNPMLGKHMSEEHKEKLRQVNVGNQYRLGKKTSEETKMKLSEAMKNRWKRLRKEGII
jgi:group I intron endonuclease